MVRLPHGIGVDVKMSILSFSIFTDLDKICLEVSLELDKIIKEKYDKLESDMKKLTEFS